MCPLCPPHNKTFVIIIRQGDGELCPCAQCAHCRKCESFANPICSMLSCVLCGYFNQMSKKVCPCALEPTVLTVDKPNFGSN